MKIIIFGLGNFGHSLALSLTETGNEVIAVDKNIQKVEIIKDQVAHAVALDSTNELAYRSLPLRDADLAVVAIGEDEGAAIITTAILKQYQHIKIISRSLSPIHDTVLQAMGVDQIVHPEQEAADRLTRKLNLKKVIDNYVLDENYSVSEIRAPVSMVGKTIIQLQFREEHGLNIITILRQREKTNLLGRRITTQEAIGLPKPDTKLEEGDILVVFGANRRIESFCVNNRIPQEL